MFKWILNSSVLIIFQNHFGQQKLVLSWALIRCGALSNLDFSWSEKWEHKHEGLIATEWQSLAVDAQKQFKPQGIAVILHSSNVILLSLFSRQEWKFNEKMIVFPTDVTILHLASKKKGFSKPLKQSEVFVWCQYSNTLYLREGWEHLWLCQKSISLNPNTPSNPWHPCC